MALAIEARVCNCGCGRMVPFGERSHPECPACQDAQHLVWTLASGPFREDHSHPPFAVIVECAHA